MPMKFPRRPRFARVFIWDSMPLFVSWNHHAEPSWILPGISSDWKQPSSVPSWSLSAGFREYRMVFGHSPVASSALRNSAMLVPQVFCAIMSKPVSGPIFAYMRAFAFLQQE